MNTGGMTLLLLCALWACAVLSAAAEPTASSRPADPFADGVTVEAIGLAPMPEGTALAEVHRQALLDARRNAVIQAHVIVEAQDRVEGMRLRDSLLRSRALGYVDQLHVWEAGAVPDSRPPVYRVRVRARVRPIPTFSALAALAQSRTDPWQPAVALRIEGNVPGHDLGRVRGILSDALQRCGVVVREPDAQRPALDLRMSVTLDEAGGAGAAVAEWELSVGAQMAPDELPAPGVFVGRWHLDMQADRGDPWRRVGMTIAQDAIRLWTAPRRTTVRFLGTSPAQAAALAKSFDRAPDAIVTVAEDRAEVSVELPMSGDPQVAVDGFIRTADVPLAVELAPSSLTYLTYQCRRPSR